MTWILGVTLGGVLALATFVVACGAWLVCRRRRQRSTTETTAADVDTRVDPDATDNRPNLRTSSPRNNEPPYSRYTKDGTLVLTVTNNCTGNGSDVGPFAAHASDTKNGIAASRTSPGKPSICTVSDDVTRFGRTTADDVNVWPCRGTDYCQAGTPCGVQSDRKYDEDYTLLRRGYTDDVPGDAKQYLSEYLHTASSSREDCQRHLSPRCRDSR